MENSSAEHHRRKVNRKGGVQDRQGYHASIPVGVVVSLALNIIGLVFSTGVIYQRVVAIENRVDEASRHKDKVDEALVKIQVTLASIDEKLKNIPTRGR